jgi:putative inorganic carbon (hco3(-)) transporter
MLRTIFVCGIIAIGAYYALRAPFFALLFYLWNAYFRPDAWLPAGLDIDLSFYIYIFLVGYTLITGAPRWTPRTGLMALFLLQALSSTLLAESPDWSWLYFVAFAKVILISYLISVLTTDVRKLRLLFLTIVVSLGFEATKQGWIGALISSDMVNQNDHPSLGDNNGVAQGMMMLLPLIVALAQTAGSRAERWFHRFTAVGVLLRGLTTFSRGGFLAALALGPMYLRRSGRRLRFVALLAVLVVFAGSLMPDAFWNRMGTITAEGDERDRSAQGRIHFWTTAMAMASAKPLTGVGVNGFQTSYNRYDTSDGEYGTDRAVHSMWFGLIAEVGVPGLLLFVAILVWTLYTSRRVIRMARDNPDLEPLVPYAVAIEVSMVAFVVSGTFLNSQYCELFWHLVGCGAVVQSLAAAAVTAPKVEGFGATLPVAVPARAAYQA